MKISTFFKSQGECVEFVKPKTKYEKIFASSIFTRSLKNSQNLVEIYGDNLEIGGTGWDLHKELPSQIEMAKPDYDLYSIKDIANKMKGIGSKEHKLSKAAEIVNAGMGFTSRGCVRSCGFCFVPKKEGSLKNVAEIRDLINPKSNVLILHDNNITADPFCIDKLHEIRDRKLVVDINQGCDVRLMSDDIALAMSEVKHLRSIHYAWDLVGHEDKVMTGIKILSKYIKPYRHMCFMLVGYDTEFIEDVYRFRKLTELGVRPYVMVYNDKPDTKLKHFERWVNSRICTACNFEEYTPWIKSQEQIRLN